MKYLYDYRFRTMMGCGADYWVLSGRINGESAPSFVSTPVSLEGNTLSTRSGSQYQLCQPDGDENVIKAEIRGVIELGQYEIIVP